MKTYPTRQDKMAIEVFEATAGRLVWTEARGWCLRTAGGTYYDVDESRVVHLHHWEVAALDLDDEGTIDCLRLQLDDPEVSLDVDRHDLRRFF